MAAAVSLGLGLLGAFACTDRSLYGTVGQEPVIPDKVTLEGVLCTDNPATRKFPVKILFIVDASGQIRDSAPFSEHTLAMEQAIQQVLPIANVEVGVIRYDNSARQLTRELQGQMSSGYTRDDAQIEAALADLRNGAGARDFAAALSLADSIVTGDAFQADLGPLSRTKYVIVHVTTGSPSPPIPSDRCDGLFESVPANCELAFLERELRLTRDRVLELGAAELSYHTVFIEPPHLEGPVCDPRGGDAGCAAGLSCVRAGGRIDSGRCVQLCDPMNPVCDADPMRSICSTTELTDGTDIDYCARAELTCFDGVDNDRDGNDRDCADPDYPYNCNNNDNCDRDCLSQCRTDDIAQALSVVTGGRYERFEWPDQINMSRIDFRSTQRTFVLKELLVDNENAIPTENGFLVDTDGDGLSDDEEALLGLNPLSRDTDGDEFGDRVEHLLRTLGMDPEMAGTPPDCEDPTIDTDGDRLKDCEEALLGTNPTLFDTDADGFPDEVEFRLGTNALFNDNLDDLDLDGVSNGREIKAHSDVTANDARVRADLAYQYRITDLGLTDDLRSCYDVRVSNVTLLATQDRGFGPGNNDITIYFGQVPQGDLERFGIFYVAQLRIQFPLPQRESGNGFDLQPSDFVLFEQ